MMEYFDPWLGDLEQEIALSAGSRRHRTALRHFDRKIAVMEIGRNVAFGGGKGGGGGSPTPDPNIGIAALKNAEIGEDWLNFAKEQFATGNIRQEEMDDLTKAVIDQQMYTAEQQQQWAEEDRARYKDKFIPLEDQFIEEASNYGSPERQAAAAAEAKADVATAVAQQRQISDRQMAAQGISPASGRSRAVTASGDLNAALASAGAQNNARTMVRDKGLALKADAVNLGKGLPSQAAAAAGLGLNAGNSATGNSNQAMNSWRSNVGIVSQGFAGAQQGYSNQANILNNLYGNQVNQWSAEQQANATSSAGIGSMVGTIAGAGITAF